MQTVDRVHGRMQRAGAVQSRIIGLSAAIVTVMRSDGVDRLHGRGMIRLRHTVVGVVCLVVVRWVRTRVVLWLNPGGHGRSRHLPKKVDRAMARRRSLGAESWDPANTCTKRTGDIPMRQLHKVGESATFP